MSDNTKDLIVATGNPAMLDATLKQLPGVIAVVCDNGIPGNYIEQDGGYLVRCFAGYGFLKFAIEQQGYGKIVKELGVVV